MPLLLYGARHVGKTYILNEFGEKHYKNTVYINFETDTATARYFDDDLNPERLVRFMETSADTVINPADTLIIFDEIQTCERALVSLKYFREDAPEYHVAAAGSLLDVAIDKDRVPFPTDVEIMTLYPMDFEEYLWALDEAQLADEIRGRYESMKPLSDALHTKATELYRCYLIVGGMPACVSSFTRSGKTILIPTIQNEIMNSYIADIAKSASPDEAKKIRACYDSVPAQLAKDNKKFRYKTVRRGGSAAMYGASIDWLIQADIALECRKIDHAMIPIAVYEDPSSFKLYQNDVGLLTARSGIPQQTVLSGQSSLFMDGLAENYIAQALKANGYTLYYWNSEFTAEIDFILQSGDDIIGIEVKKGIKERSKSLSVFTRSYPTAYNIRFAEKNFGYDSGFRAIPHYAAFCV